VLTDSHELLSTLEQKVLPAHAALLVVDVQNDFVADGGFFDKIGADVKTIQRAIPPLVQLIDCARQAGVLVIFIQAIYDPQYLSSPMREREPGLQPLLMGGREKILYQSILDDAIPLIVVTVYSFRIGT
jgi:ureidoacrylate peracid hydrolase